MKLSFNGTTINLKLREFHKARLESEKVKFNLKNRPARERLDPSSDEWIDPEAVHEWFEGFEKELREIMFVTLSPSKADLVKEILGE